MRTQKIEGRLEALQQSTSVGTGCGRAKEALEVPVDWITETQL